jgi:hypothetical protein
MASIGGASIQDDLVRGIIAEVKSLTVDRLKRVLRSEGQLMSGIKTELQTRLIARRHMFYHPDTLAVLTNHLPDILDAERRNDQVQLRRIRDAVRGYPYNPQQPQPSNPYPSPYSNHTPASSASPQFYNNSPTPRLPPVTSITGNMPPVSGYTQRMFDSNQRMGSSCVD